MSDSSVEAQGSEALKFDRQKHLRFLQGCLRLLPASYASQDPNRLTLLYFIVSGLDLFDSLDLLKDKEAIINWIYSLQVLPDKDNSEKHFQNCGFRGSPFFGAPFNPTCDPCELYEHDQAHIAMTYTALCILLILGDDLSRINKTAITKAMRTLQQVDGSFSSTAGNSEHDMRFVFCACAISTILNDWSGIDCDKALDYVVKSQSYDYVFGQGPGQEGHGGSTYCAVAACALMGRLDVLGFSQWPDNISPHSVAVGHHGAALQTDERAVGLIDFLVRRQITGFQGRIGKDPDACYSWWIGSSLQMLGHFDQIDQTQLRHFLLSCQAPIGGFGKYPDTQPDVLHTYFSLCGFSFLKEEGLLPLHCALGLTMRAAKRIPGLNLS